MRFSFMSCRSAHALSFLHFYPGNFAALMHLAGYYGRNRTRESADTGVCLSVRIDLFGSCARGWLSNLYARPSPASDGRLFKSRHAGGLVSCILMPQQCHVGSIASNSGLICVRYEEVSGKRVVQVPGQFQRVLYLRLLECRGLEFSQQARTLRALGGDPG